MSEYFETMMMAAAEVERLRKENKYLLAIHAASLQWSTEPPTVEGWYWARVIGDRSEPEIDIIYVNSDLEFLATTQYLGVGSGYISHWLGPLPVPKAPQ